MMRRIEIGQDQNFHRPDRDSRQETMSWRAIPGIRALEVLRSINVHLLDSRAAPFPLTLTLSLREREQRALRSRKPTVRIILSAEKGSRFPQGTGFHGA